MATNDNLEDTEHGGEQPMMTGEGMKAATQAAEAENRASREGYEKYVATAWAQPLDPAAALLAARRAEAQYQARQLEETRKTERDRRAEADLESDEEASQEAEAEQSTMTEEELKVAARRAEAEYQASQESDRESCPCGRTRAQVIDLAASEISFSVLALWEQVEQTMVRLHPEHEGVSKGIGDHMADLFGDDEEGGVSTATRSNDYHADQLLAEFTASLAPAIRWLSDGGYKALITAGARVDDERRAASGDRGRRAMKELAEGLSRLGFDLSSSDNE